MFVAEVLVCLIDASVKIALKGTLLGPSSSHLGLTMSIASSHLAGCLMTLQSTKIIHANAITMRTNNFIVSIAFRCYHLHTGRSERTNEIYFNPSHAEISSNWNCTRNAQKYEFLFQFSLEYLQLIKFSLQCNVYWELFVEFICRINWVFPDRSMAELRN